MASIDYKPKKILFFIISLLNSCSYIQETKMESGQNDQISRNNNFVISIDNEKELNLDNKSHFHIFIDDEKHCVKYYKTKKEKERFALIHNTYQNRNTLKSLINYSFCGISTVNVLSYSKDIIWSLYDYYFNDSIDNNYNLKYFQYWALAFQSSYQLYSLLNGNLDHGDPISLRVDYAYLCVSFLYPILALCIMLYPSYTSESFDIALEETIVGTIMFINGLLSIQKTLTDIKRDKKLLKTQEHVRIFLDQKKPEKKYV